MQNCHPILSSENLINLRPKWKKNKTRVTLGLKEKFI